jgi:peptide/nickel transport system permease protein
VARHAGALDGELAVPLTPGRARRASVLRAALRSRTATFGAATLLVVALCGLLAPLVAPYNPNEQSISERFLPPIGLERGSQVGTTAHWFGTDHLGRDILSRIVHGARISLLVGLSAVLISGMLGVLLGLLAGYHGGRLDALIMRVADIQLAFPFILLAIAIVAVLGQGVRNVIIVLGLAGWVVFARVVRGDVLSIREREFILAARTIGASDRTILLRHVLPNVSTPVVIIASFTVANVIILEAALSFLGLGVEPAIPTWGAMLADGRQYLSVVWWPATLPGLAIMLTVLSINMIGDWLRDILDPRLKHL